MAGPLPARPTRRSTARRKARTSGLANGMRRDSAKRAARDPMRAANFRTTTYGMPASAPGRAQRNALAIRAACPALRHAGDPDGNHRLRRLTHRRADFRVSRRHAD